MYRLKTENAGYKPDIGPRSLRLRGTISGLYPNFEVFNRLKTYMFVLGRFSNKNLSTLKIFVQIFRYFPTSLI